MSDRDTLLREAQAAAREFPATEAAFAKVRAAMVKRLFETPNTADAERERLYFAVQILDAVKGELVSAMSQGAIEEYAERIGSKT